MGALRHVTPTPQLDQFGRDPQSPAEQLRRKTNYAKGTGYAPLFHAMVADIPRLTRGSSCTSLLLPIMSLQDRTERDGWTPGLSLADWANLANCDEKEVQRNRDYLKLRKMADCKVDVKRLYSFRLRPETWQALEDYKTWFAKQAKAEADDEPERDDPAQNDENKPGNWRMSKPVTVPRGKTSKAFDPGCGIAKIKFQTPLDTPDGVDIAYYAVVQAGELRITPSVTLALGVQKAKIEAKTDSSAVSRGHGRPPRSPQTGVSGRRNSGEQKSVDHPRASELINLFDPLLGKSGAVLLAMDAKSLQAACDALADCDHDYLIKFVMNRADRGPIRNVRTVPTICGEALASWKASRVLDSAGAKRYSHEDIQELIRQERAAKKKAAKV